MCLCSVESTWRSRHGYLVTLPRGYSHSSVWIWTLYAVSPQLAASALVPLYLFPDVLWRAERYGPSFAVNLSLSHPKVSVKRAFGFEPEVLSRFDMFTRAKRRRSPRSPLSLQLNIISPSISQSARSVIEYINEIATIDLCQPNWPIYTFLI